MRLRGHTRDFLGVVEIVSTMKQRRRVLQQLIGSKEPSTFSGDYFISQISLNQCRRMDLCAGEISFPSPWGHREPRACYLGW